MEDKPQNSVNFGPDCGSQIEGWAEYFQKLANAEVLPHFDEEFHSSMKLKRHSLAIQCMKHCNDQSHDPISEKTIAKHVKALKTGKAADVYGLTTEHIKYADTKLLHFLTEITNDVFSTGKLPDQFKIGALAPVHKKGKPIKNPDNYRRITIAATLGKVVEKEMMCRTKARSKPKQDPLQYGFTEDCSPSVCALMITEAIAEAKDMDKPLYITFLDSSKAFDMVDHTALLNSLHDIGIDPHLWQLYHDMYTSVTSKVRLNGELSEEIKEGRGVRQGGETSTEGFKSKENPFLDRVRKHPDSLRIGCIPMGIPTVADDNCMMASTHQGAQLQLLLAEQNAARVRYVFSSSKSKVMLIPDKAGKNVEEKIPLRFNNTNISHSNREVHLGLIRTASGSTSEAVAHRIQIGRRTAYSLMSTGLHGMNGISPHISKNLVRTYVIPAAMYGLEALVLNDANEKELDNFHRGLLRQLQSLPESTARPLIHMLTGTIPLQATLHQNMLTLFNTILHRPTTPEYDIIIRQLTIKDSSSHSWTVKLKHVLFKYSLPPALTLAESPPEKEMWKRTIKEAIAVYWDRELKEEARFMKSLKYLNPQMCQPGYSHPVWLTGTDPFQTTMAVVKAIMLAGRYTLTVHKCTGTRQLPKCPHCNMEPETLKHFILLCPTYEDVRSPYLHRLKHNITNMDISQVNSETLLKIILDPSHISDSEDEAIHLEDACAMPCTIEDP